MQSNPFFHLLITIVLGSLGGWVLVRYGGTLAGAVVGLFFLVIIAFSLKDFTIPFVLLLTLALGSAYDWRIAQSSYYVRFVLLGLVTLRAVFFFLGRLQGSGRKSDITFSPLHITFFVVSFIGLLSTAYSVNPATTFQRALSFLMLTIVIFLFFWPKAESQERMEEIAISMWWTIVVVLGVGYLFLLMGIPGMFYGGRLRLVLGNPNQLGHYTALFAPIGVWYMFERAKGKRKIFAVSVVAAMALALVLSGSRAALLSVTVAMGLMFGLCYTKKLLALGMVVILIASVHFLMGDPAPSPGEDPSFLQEHVMREGQLETGSGRVPVWKGALRLIGKQPLLGYGFGSVETLFHKGYFPEIREFQGAHVHNSYLEELVNLGWLGALPIFFSLFYVLFQGAFVIIRANRNTPEFRFFVALYAILVVGVISGTFESWFTSVGSIFCFPYWLSVALLLKLIRVSPKLHDVESMN